MSSCSLRVPGFAVAFVLLTSSGIHAGQISWSFQLVDVVPAGSATQIDLGLNANAHWPKVFYEKTSPGDGMRYLAAASLKPTGWSTTVFSTLPISSSSSGFVHAAAAPTSVGAVWRAGNSYQVAQSSGSGWQVSTVGMTSTVPPPRAAMCYGPDGNAMVAYSDGAKLTVATRDGNGWQKDIVDFGGFYETGQFPSIAVDELGTVHLVYSRNGPLWYAVRDINTGKWSKTQIVVPRGGLPDYSLALDADGVPYFTYLHSGILDLAGFDRASGKWQLRTLATGVSSHRVHLAFDANNRAGVAFVSGGMVNLMLNDGGGWATHVLPTGPNSIGGFERAPTGDSEVAMGFDADNLPVLGYYSPTGVLLAYDPVVPEPATVLFAAGLLVAAARRRHR